MRLGYNTGWLPCLVAMNIYIYISATLAVGHGFVSHFGGVVDGFPR